MATIPSTKENFQIGAAFSVPPANLQTFHSSSSHDEISGPPEPCAVKSHLTALRYLQAFPAPSIDQLNDHSKQVLPSYLVMIVEDNPLNQKVVQKLLEGLNQKILIQVKDGKQALEYLNQTNQLPDLIITDRCMPVMGGFEFVQSLRENPSLTKLPCMLWSEGDFKTEGFIELGIETFLPKPVDKIHLAKVLTHFAIQKGDLYQSQAINS